MIERVITAQHIDNLPKWRRSDDDHADFMPVKVPVGAGWELESTHIAPGGTVMQALVVFIWRRMDHADLG